MNKLPLGKLPPEILSSIITKAPISDPRIILGPGIGLDCAVVEMGDTCLVFKSDPITFTSDEIGWYAVQINANDIATTGAIPRWFLVTTLFPEENTTEQSVEEISSQVFNACRALGISVIGGHTEITYGIDRPIIAGTMIGEVAREKLITPKGVSPGDRVLLTKGIPIEGTAIIAREFSGELQKCCSDTEIQTASNYLHKPGISVVQDAKLAAQAGTVSAMHDPTEGGLSGALWELAEACQYTLVIDPQAVIISPLSDKICRTVGVDPMGTIASGALLLTCPSGDSKEICQALGIENIACTEIGSVVDGPPQVLTSISKGTIPLPRPERDEITKLFEN
jgi:hydrogenase expression/formation protein HypE